MYVLSLPLYINMTLTDPTAVNTIVSCIKCICHIKIILNKINFFAQYMKCQKSNNTIKWIMNFGTSMAFISIISDFSKLIYFIKRIAFVLGFGTVFIQTSHYETKQIIRIHLVFYLPWLCINTLTFFYVNTKNVVFVANTNKIYENIY